MPTPQHTSFSDFFHNASPEEKKRVMLEVAREATNDQRAQIGLPPLHTSPEKEETVKIADYYDKEGRLVKRTANGVDIPLYKEGFAIPAKEVCNEAVIQEGLNRHYPKDDWNLSKHPVFIQGGSSVTISRAKEPTYIESVLEEFRESFKDGVPRVLMSTEFDGVRHPEIEQFLREKLEESAKNERSYLLTVIESTRKRFKCGACGGAQKLGHTHLCTALTSLAAEIDNYPHQSTSN